MVEDPKCVQLQGPEDDHHQKENPYMSWDVFATEKWETSLVRQDVA